MRPLTVSVVTVSFNQAPFLERAIRSVVEQAGVAVDYIVVDPGSTDGSREIIERYRDRIAHVVFEKDEGAADGLNKGFARATGDIWCYLNSDDAFEPGALATAANWLAARPTVDVACGHAWVVDADDTILRKVWSDPFDPLMVAHGRAIQIQPSTFIRASAMRDKVAFNPDNRSNWDGELLVDLHRSGARIAVIDKVLSRYRLHRDSITASGSQAERIAQWSRRRFEILMGRPMRPSDRIVSQALKVFRQVRNPAAAVERLRRGPLFRRFAA